MRELHFSRCLQISDEPVGPEIGYFNLDSVVARMNEGINPRCKGLPPKSIDCAAIHKNGGNLAHLADLEPVAGPG